MLTLGNCQLYSDRSEISTRRDFLINVAATQALGVGSSMQDVWTRFSEVNNNIVAEQKESAYNALNNLFGTFWNMQIGSDVKLHLIASACHRIGGERVEDNEVTIDALPETCERIKMTATQADEALEVVKKKFLRQEESEKNST